MSLADLSVSPSDSGGGSDLGRTPPQDVAAEQSVLGGMMLSKDAIADVVEELKGVDFYRPAHELVYDSILDLYGRGEPADAVTVAAELTKRGELSKVGGPAYIHTLISSVPTAANAGYYARIVRERAVLRRLVDAGTRIVQLGYNGADGRGGGDVEEIVNSAQAEIYKVSEARTSEDYAALSEVIEGAIDEIEASSHRGDGLTGVPTGFADLDALTNGLHPGQMIIIAARPAMGKALALDTPMPTPQGWTTMGAVQVGDELIGADGKPTRVVNATDVMVGRPCYEVEFSDGTVIVADAEHQWLTETRGSHSAGVRTTEQIAATLRRDTADRSLNHSVINAEALNLPEQDLLVPPYTLGAWLGDDIRAEPGVVMRLEDDGLDFGDFSALTGALRTIGVLGEKHIPASYLRASQAQRRDLLAGLLDTNGTVHSNGAVQFSATSERLALGARELVISLGYRCTVVNLGDALLLTFTTGDRVFNLERKHLLHKDRMSRRFHRHDSRFITAVRPISSVPVRCVEVDNQSHLYLAGRTMIPTHNSTFGLDILRSAAIHHRMTSVMFSLEMGRNEITMRLLSAEARIPLQNMRKGTMREEDWTRLAKTMGDVSDAPLFIDDSPNMSLMEIRAKCRRLKQRHDLKLVVIDYLQLMTSGKRVESRQQEVSEFSRAIKLLAKELQLPVIALSQLNRGPEQRTDKKPAMSDLRESGCLTADTRILRADTGAEVTMGELFESGAKDVPVWALDDSLRYVRRHLTHVFSTGTKQVFKVRLASGKEVRATANHPFLTYEGWTPIGDLAPGARVAAPRHVMAPELVTSWDNAEVVALAHRVGRTSEPLPVALFSLPKRQISLFLNRLWAEGSVVVDPERREGRVNLTLPSRRLLEDVSRLLLRFGISARLLGADSLEIAGADDQRRFLKEIGVHGAGSEPSTLLEIVGDSSGMSAAMASPETWQRVYAVLARQKADVRVPLAVATNRTPLTSVSLVPKQPLGEVADALGDADLEMHAVNDVVWDSIVAIEPDGVEDVYDATVAGSHNFIANGIAVHNSIEQDADMVILLHREDAYEKESPRAGEADFIVAKHRNGPTDTITVAFQGHYSRFVDMAQ